jgi:protein TonB
MLGAILVSLALSLAPQQPAAAAAQPKPDQPWPPAGVVRVDGEVKAPKLVYEIKASYTGDARRAAIQGVIVMEAVVLVDGTVGEVRVTRSLDKQHGLDDEAVRALRKWRFEPGTKDGVAVPVVVEVEMTFTVRK